MDLQPKIKFIQVHKDALPPKQDGFGFNFQYVGFQTAHRYDGKDVACLYTGWEMIVPEGYIGQVYDLDVTKGMSIQRMQTSMFVDSTFPYNKDDENKNWGFFIVYNVIGGLSSVILTKQQAMVGISFFKKHSLLEMETEVKIHIPKPKEEQKDPVAETTISSN